MTKKYEHKINLDTSELIKAELPCRCGSSDALAYYQDEDDNTHTKCFSCNEFLVNPSKDQLVFDIDTLSTTATSASMGAKGGWASKNKNNKGTDMKEKSYEEIEKEYSKGVFKELKFRKLEKATCQKYGVKHLQEGPYKRPAHIFPLYHRDSGNHIVSKIRGQKPKENSTDEFVRHFVIDKAYQGANRHIGLFGQNAFPEGSAKFITITTGEYDAMSIYQMTGSKYPCVSVPNGDDNALRAIQENWKYLSSFDTIVLAFDNDESGIRTCRKVVEHFKNPKFKILKIPNRLKGVDEDIKDANDYLRHGNSSNFIDLWWKAETYTPQDLVLSSQLKERMKERKKIQCYDYPWEGLNKMTYGMRKQEITLVKARRGVGKTQVIRELIYGVLNKYPEEQVGALFIEETPTVSAEGLMSLSANKRLHLPDADYTEEEWEKAYQEVLAKDRIIFYDGFGMNDADSVLESIEWMYHQTGAQFMILDSLTLMTVDHTSDERKKLDSVASRLKDLRQKYNLHICAVVHENRDGEVRGSDGPENMANVVFSLERDQKNPDPVIRNTTNILVEKNRFSGDTGPACSLTFDPETGRLKEKDFEFEDEFEINHKNETNEELE